MWSLCCLVKAQNIDNYLWSLVSLTCRLCYKHWLILPAVPAWCCSDVFCNNAVVINMLSADWCAPPSESWSRHCESICWGGVCGLLLWQQQQVQDKSCLYVAFDVHVVIRINGSLISETGFLQRVLLSHYD